MFHEKNKSINLKSEQKNRTAWFCGVKYVESEGSFNLENTRKLIELLEISTMLNETKDMKK